MWSREMLKSYAKNFLRRHYWKAFIVCLIVTIVGGSGNNSGNNNYKINNRNRYYNNQSIERNTDDTPIEYNNPFFIYFMNKSGKSPVVYIAKTTLVLLVLGFIFFAITIGYALEVGRARFFLKGFKEDIKIGYLFSTFNSKEYLSIIKTIFLRNLFGILWSLLFIIPGIIKFYEYRMVSYIVSEEPNISTSEAIQMSRDMTDGHKMDMFILDLSFLGWYLLGLLFFGIGGIFVNPYKEATFAKLYNVLSGNDKNHDNFVLE